MQTQPKLTKYYIAAITAFAMWGFFSLALKPLHEYPSLDILFYRVFLCAILMLLLTFTIKRNVLKQNIQIFNTLARKQKRRIVLLNVCSGLLITGNWFLFIYVMNHISVKAASLAYLVCPIITTVIAYLLLKEKLTKQQWLAIGISVIGCLLLSFNHLIDLVFSLVVGASYALYLVIQRRNTGLDKFLVLTFHIVFSALLLLPFYPFFSGPVPVNIKFYTYASIIAVFFTIVPLFLNLYALKGLTSSITGMLININPIIGFILAITVYQEKVDLIQTVAYTIIFISVITFNIRFGKKQTAELANV
ncbi:MAG: EamA family transporter [Sphingobacteriaceae bacterium]|nr:MAG: EamA family transporter [Sphingobacteriaceae bacterium]